MEKTLMIIDPGQTTAASVYKLMIDVIVPRPIAFVSTVSASGRRNLAPFSFFNGVASTPPMIMISAGRKRDGSKKDTGKNIEETGEFVVNIVTESIAEAMNVTSAEFPGEIDEFQCSGLTPVAGDLVRAPRVKESPVSFECRLVQSLDLGSPPSTLIIGEIVRFHIADELFEDGHVDPARLKPIGRLGGARYCRVNDIFEMQRPKLQSV